MLAGETVLIDVILIVALAVLVGVYVSWRAGRLDRLHARVDTARAALDAALLRRSSVALELAACGVLDPATSLLLAGAAHDARAAGEPTELAESDLTRALRAVVGQPVKWGISLPRPSPPPVTTESSISKNSGSGAPPARPSRRTSHRRRAARVAATASL